MYGLFGGENSIQRRHMWPVSVNSTTVAALDSSTPDFFCKDGRKIRVGDCALFEPPRDSPPFIGIIRRLTLDKENTLYLSVNWLYRAADIKLAKGTLLEAALNEVFFSFHKDEIPAASLLHPCKVAFLRKGVELPSGISSFVCRRVYDIENKCLWWLTDKDYINERQEEVDQLLDKTRLEMHGVVQSGGRSPKPSNAQTSASQLKSGSDSAQHSPSFSSQGKGKKRISGEQGSDSAKRERLSKAEDCDSGPFKAENILKSEIAKITDKGGLVGFEGVEKLVKLMLPDNSEKKIDLIGRIMLVDAIAVTDRFDCLGRFVQLKGLPVLNEWLQEVHKGKIGDCSIPKENDKSVEEFLLASLRALEKLPVNLHALQTCNIGKSVNQLRSHKNYEIQRKARGLVDTWKKRVKMEMNINDAKLGSNHSVSWTTKSVPSEASHVGNRKNGGSAEIGAKTSITQLSSAKVPHIKFGTVESVAKSSASPGSAKLLSASAVAISKEPSGRTIVVTGNSDLPLTPIKEGRSSSSSHSQNNSQSCSSDRAKTIGSCREDARSSTAGSGSVNRIASGSSRRRQSSNGPHGSASGIHKENGTGKACVSNKDLASGKASQTGVSQEKLPDGSHVDHGNGQRLIVRFPDTGQSPVSAADEGSIEDPAVVGSILSPVEKHDENNRNVKGTTDALSPATASGMNTDVCDSKDGLRKPDEGNVVAPCDKRRRGGEDYEKEMEGSKATGSSSVIFPRSGKLYEASLSSINALVESCAKFSEVGASSSPGDDVGMNLLASVATEEISKYEIASPSGSPGRHSPVLEDAGNYCKLRQLGEEVAQTQYQPNNEANVDSVDLLQGKNEVRQNTIPLSTFSGDSKATSVGSGDKAVEYIAQLGIPPSKLQDNLDDSCLRSDVKPGELTRDASLAKYSFHDKTESDMDAEREKPFCEQRKSVAHMDRSTSASDSKMKVNTPSLSVENSAAVVPEASLTNTKVEKEVDEESLCSSSETGGETRSTMEKESCNNILTEQKPSLLAEVHLEQIERKCEDDVHSDSGHVLGTVSKFSVAETLKVGGAVEKNEQQTLGLGSSISDQTSECTEEDFKRKVALGHSVGVDIPHIVPPTIPGHEIAQCGQPTVVEKDGIGSEGKAKHHASRLIDSPTVGSDVPVKLDFDLNEGFPVDDGTQREMSKLSGTRTESTVHLPCPLPFPVSFISGNLPASITVATAAKGAVVPPENPLRSKGEFRSAASSAFRPAEPRKNLEVLLNSADIPVNDAPASKQSRPPLDFDLNIPDERALEDVASQSTAQATSSEYVARDGGAGGLDLDLNRVDENADIGPFSISNNSRLEISPLSNRSSLFGRLSNTGVNVSRDFDLNNGPGVDEAGTEAPPRSQHMKSSIPFQSPVPGIRMTSQEFGNFTSWFPQGNSYPAITVPSILHGRGEQSYVAAPGSQRILGPTGSNSFGQEIYRGPVGQVLSSSPAVAFPSATPFQFPGFPFETGFPLSSNSFSGNSTAYMESSSSGPLCFPAIASQLAGPGSVVSSPYPRPYLMNLPGGPSNVGSESRKWGSQGFDLNTGPGASDTERRDERLPSALRHLSTPSSQTLAEEQLKMYQMAVGMLKRREPDSGWDPADRFGYKQP